MSGKTVFPNREIVKDKIVYKCVKNTYGFVFKVIGKYCCYLLLSVHGYDRSAYKFSDEFTKKHFQKHLNIFALILYKF